MLTLNVSHGIICVILFCKNNSIFKLLEAVTHFVMCQCCHDELMENSTLQLYCTSTSSRMQVADTDVSSEHDTHMAPHVLALSATPIPRTLALALYGDMSLTNVRTICGTSSCLNSL